MPPAPASTTGSPLSVPHQTSSTPGATLESVAGDADPRHETAFPGFESVEREAWFHRSCRRAPSRALRAALPPTLPPAVLLLRLPCVQVFLPAQRSAAAVACPGGADLCT